MGGTWVSLYSGGKDSAWSLYRALEVGHPVEAIVTVHPPPDSYLYHVPATELTDLAARSLGVPLIEVSADVPTDGVRDVGIQGDRELEPLETALRDYRGHHDLGGVTAGAVASEYQARRLREMCDRLGCALFTPLWDAEPLSAGRAMVDAGFDIRIVRVAADGLDATWLGRRLDHAALNELAGLHDRRGIHVLGEGGEYETLVVDGPPMSRRIRFDAEPVWEGTHGTLAIDEAWLAD